MSTTPVRHKRTRHHDRAEDHEGGHERWLVTYADMLTLLLVLFVVLYAMSQVDRTKFTVLKDSLASAFHNGSPSILNAGNGLVGGSSGSVSNSAINQPIANTLHNNQITQYVPVYDVSKMDAAKKEYDQFKKVEKSISDALTKQGYSGAASFSIDERGLVVTIVTDDLVFGGNSATLEPKGKKIIDAVLPALMPLDNQLQVDGHTNQANVSTNPYPTGWELSSARASAVVEYLISKGFAPSHLSAVGFSDQRPLVDPKDPTSVTRNRRVDIVVLSKFTGAGLPAGAPTTATAPTTTGGN